MIPIKKPTKGQMQFIAAGLILFALIAVAVYCGGR